MLKILSFAIVFFAGIALGGGLRYSQVEAQLSEVEIQNVITPTSGGSMGQAAGGTCG